MATCSSADQTSDGNYYELSHDSLVVPILTTRRLWFLARSGRLILALVGTLVVLAVVTIMLGAAMLAPSEWGIFEAVLMMIGLPLVYMLGRAVFQSSRELVTTWRRLRV